jgi:hypothetical protein
MKRFPLLVIASAVAAALAAPVALAQTTPGADRPSAPQHSPTDGRSGGTGPTSGTPMPSNRPGDATRPGDPIRSPSSDTGTIGRQQAPANPQHSPTDGRAGGTGPMSGTPMPTTGGMHDMSTVRDAQQALRDKGYEVGPVDGISGPRTQAAVRDFQQKEGLAVTGRLDQKTLSALNVDGGTRSDRRSGSGG